MRSPVLAAVLALAGVYALGVGSVLFSPEGSKVAVWWPAADLSVALLILAPRRWRLVLTAGIVLAGAAANYTARRLPLTAACAGRAPACQG